MAFQDRAYYRDSNRPGGSNPLMWLLAGSVSLGSWFGINVRLHASLILLLLISLIFPNALGGPFHSLTFSIVLLASVLFHEFGHCVGSRFVGGNPTEIILTPLGGLALADAPRRPWATFITVACGPLVNLLICAVCSLSLLALNHTTSVIPFNPFHVFIPSATASFILWWVFIVNWGLFLFNVCWPVFPLDGGQLLQSLLWVKLGYYRSMNIACSVGIAGAIVMAMLGISTGRLLFLFIAISCLLTCIMMRTQIKAAGPYAFEDESDTYAASQWTPERPTSKKRLSKRTLRRALQEQQAAELEQSRVDSILAKVSAQGMNSLTWREKRTLHKATEKIRRSSE